MEFITHCIFFFFYSLSGIYICAFYVNNASSFFIGMFTMWVLVSTARIINEWDEYDHSSTVGVIFGIVIIFLLSLWGVTIVTSGG